MSYHAPHGLTESELGDSDAGEVGGGVRVNRFVVEECNDAVMSAGARGGLSETDLDAAAVGGVALGSAALEQPTTIWMLVNADHQTTMIQHTGAALGSREEAEKCARKLGLGVRELVVYPTMAAWEAAGRPLLDN
jgi:hypothetical protein